MATPLQTAQRHDTINYGVKIPNICRSFVSTKVGPDRRRVFQDPDFVFDDADKNFDLLFNAIRAGRSLVASYNIQSDIQSKSRQQALLLANRCV